MKGIVDSVVKNYLESILGSHVDQLHSYLQESDVLPQDSTFITYDTLIFSSQQALVVRFSDGITAFVGQTKQGTRAWKTPIISYEYIELKYAALLNTPNTHSFRPADLQLPFRTHTLKASKDSGAISGNGFEYDNIAKLWNKENAVLEALSSTQQPYSSQPPRTNPFNHD
jgi:hypothetical protein